MAETVNIGEISARLSKDIFKYFFWEAHPKTDDNFQCVNGDHASEKSKPLATHPCDVVFHYLDPYMGKRVYLHTDLKSYAKDSITSTKLRTALRSLCLAVDCARFSTSWAEKYTLGDGGAYDVRGLLFVYNHDNKYEKDFGNAISKIDLQKLPIATGTQLHFLGPGDIKRLYSIANDIIRLKGEGELPSKYTFYYPDLVMTRRQVGGWEQAATIEVLTSPYIIIRHDENSNGLAGYVIYYNAPAATSEEFEYFLDSLSRFQMLETSSRILIKVTSQSAPDDLKSVFSRAKNKYVKAWGFDSYRAEILHRIEIERITSMTSTYNPGDIGWR